MGEQTGEEQGMNHEKLDMLRSSIGMSISTALMFFLLHDSLRVGVGLDTGANEQF